MRIGDIRMEAPSFWTTFGHSEGAPQKCRVVYIHPRRRFYTVEFAFPLTGERFRESYYFEDRRGDAGQKGYGHEDDSDYEQQGRRRENRHRHQPGGHPGP